MSSLLSSVHTEDYVFSAVQISGSHKEVCVCVIPALPLVTLVTTSDHFIHVCVPPLVSVIGNSFLRCASREALRWAVFSMQAAGHVLLGSSCYIEYLLQEEEETTKSLSLPQESRMRQLQSMLLGKASQWWDWSLVMMEGGQGFEIAVSCCYAPAVHQKAVLSNTFFSRE